MPLSRKPRLLVAVAFTGAALVMTGCAGAGGGDDAGAVREAASAPRKPVETTPATEEVKTRTGATPVSAGLVRSATLTDVPASALAAYQRAANAMSTADAGCHLSWTLLAAIGKVESNHGRDPKATTAAKGIVGPRLDGTKGTPAVPDTDLGTLDGDKTWDHAVGPMQMLPATWSEVAVDGDGDGIRNPQDIDDAALGAAVYLCGGSEDLAQDTGARAALLGYNRDAAYATLVQSVAKAYAKQEKASVVLNTGTVQAVNLTSVDETSRMAAGEVARERADDRRKAAAAKKKAAAKKAAAAKPTATTPKPTTPATTPPRPTKPTAPTPPPPPPPVTKVVTPHVVGTTYDAAVSALARAGLTGTITKTEVFDPAAAGTVLSSDPSAGTLVEKGSGASLTVSLGPVADVVGKTFAEAKSALSAQGFDVATTGADATDDAVVSAQTPGKDSTKVAKGATVTLTLTAPGP